MDLVILEAMASGLPCIATDVPCVNEAVRHGATGILIGFGDASQFADAVVRLAEDGGLRASMGAEARRVAVEEFDIRCCTPLFQEAYKRTYAKVELPSAAAFWRDRLVLPARDRTLEKEPEAFWRRFRWRSVGTGRN